MKSFINTTLIILTTLLGFQISSAQSNQYPNLLSNKKVTTVLYIEKGKEINYHVTNSTTAFKNEKEKPNDDEKTEYDLHLRVTDSTEHSYTFELTYSEFKQTGKKTEFDIATGRIMEGITIKFKTDEFGVYDTIINLNELSEKMEETVDLLIKDYLDKIKNDEQKTIFLNKMEMMKSLFTDPKNLEISFMQEIIYIFGLYGIQMELNKPVEYEVEFPVLENLSMMGKATLTLKIIDKLNDRCFFDNIEKPNQDEIKKFMRFILITYFPEVKPKNFEEELKELKYNTTTSKNYTMQLSTGLFEKIKSKTTTKVTSGKKSNKVIVVKEYKLK